MLIFYFAKQKNKNLKHCKRIHDGNVRLKHC